MRLTHLCKYADKRKNREPMLKIRNKLFNYENIEERHNIKSLDDLDNRLKALEIIKEKRVNVCLLLVSDFKMYNQWADITPLTQEEYDLLKEVLL